MSEYTEKHFQDWFDDNRDVLRFMSLEQLAEFAYVAGYKGRETEPATEADSPIPSGAWTCKVCGSWSWDSSPECDYCDTPRPT